MQAQQLLRTVRSNYSQKRSQVQGSSYLRARKYDAQISEAGTQAGVSERCGNVEGGQCAVETIPLLFNLQAPSDIQTFRNSSQSSSRLHTMRPFDCDDGVGKARGNASNMCISEDRQAEIYESPERGGLALQPKYGVNTPLQIALSNGVGESTATNKKTMARLTNENKENSGWCLFKEN